MKRKVSFGIFTALIIFAGFAFKVSDKKADMLNINNPILPVPNTTWVIDKAHSNVKFAITHMVVSEVEGSFKLFDGTMENTKADFSDAKISFTVDVASINTDNEMRENHLKGDDFFNAEKYPQMKFVSTAFTPAGGNKYKLAGNLTIRDVTKPVVFDVTYGGTVKANNGEMLGFKAKTTIDRLEYGLKWNKAVEAGGMVVSKEVDITVNVEMKKGA
ncbi:MAG: YceI family protein [Ginsengibacter sp.]